jgi:RimJ/RimL family protein N-acetyltransferase
MKLHPRHAVRAKPERLPDGRHVFLRPLVDDDLVHAQEFFEAMSADSRYTRFMMPMPRLSEETIAALVEAMHDPRAAVIAALSSNSRHARIVGGARIVPTSHTGSCEFALTVIDSWQGRGIGHALLRACVRLAKEHGYHEIVGCVLTNNWPMLAVAKRLRFRLRLTPGDTSVTLVSRRLYG